jgi:ankyrin repeat protein
MLQHDADASTIPVSLCFAIGENNLPVVERCISGGADIDAADEEGQTAMHFAVYLNRVEVVQLLCRHGAQPRWRDSLGFTALMRAAEHGRDEILATLLQNGHSAAAAHHSSPVVGATPMMLACSARGGQPGHLRVLRLLIAAGESLQDASAVHRESALHAAAYYNHLDAAALLLGGGSLVDSRTANGSTPLHCAAHQGNADMVLLLVQHGADPNHLTDHGNTPLHAAMHVGSVDCIAAMIRAGGDIQTRNMHGRALIHYLAELPVAALRSVEDMVDVLNVRDDFGNGLLHLAARAQNYALAHCLCATGAADPNYTNTVGDTALHEAVREAYPDIVEVLVRGGASIYISNSQGVSALDLSRQSCAGGQEKCSALHARRAFVAALLNVHAIEVDRVRDSIGGLLLPAVCV